MNFSEKTAVVTGGSRGLGRAICLELARGGANVVLCYAGNEAAANETVAACESLGAKAVAIRCDVSKEDEVKALMDAALKTFGRIDILVNNAGITRDGLLMMMKPEDFDAVIAANLRGAFLCMKAVARQMVKQRYGRIVNLSSVVGLRGNAGQVNYAASKAGVIGMTKSLAKELAGGIFVELGGAEMPDRVKHDLCNGLVADEVLAGDASLGGSSDIHAPDELLHGVCNVGRDGLGLVVHAEAAGDKTDLIVALFSGEVERHGSGPCAAVAVRHVEACADGVCHGVAAVAVALAGQAEVGSHGHVRTCFEVFRLLVRGVQVRPGELKGLAADHLGEDVALHAAERFAGVGDSVHAGSGDIGRQALCDLRIEEHEVGLCSLGGQRSLDAESLGGDDAGAGGLCAGAGSGGDAYEMRLAGKIRAVVPLAGLQP